MADEPERYLKIGEAARYCAMSPVTLRRAAAAGELKGAQNHSHAHWRFRKSDLDRWLTGQPTEGKETP